MGIASILTYLRSLPDLRARTPEVIALLLAAGLLYSVAAYFVERYAMGFAALVIILAAALAFRFIVLSVPPTLSADVYRYQWEGRVQRAGINPYTTHPDALAHLALEEPGHRLDVGRSTPTLYPPLSEWSFSWARTIAGYKRLYTGMDLASCVALLLLLRVHRQPLARVLMYAWNPGVVVAFAMCGHHDALAILTLLTANFMIIRRQGGLSILFLALSFLSKFFSALLLPVFLGAVREPSPPTLIRSEAKDLGRSPSTPNRITHRSAWGARCAYGALFLVVVAAGYLPWASGGGQLLDGLFQYTSGWENNDSLFRLMRLAGNSKGQAGLLAASFLTALVIFVLKRRLEPLQASLVLIAALLLLSPNAFPWYFTWMTPFLCFHTHPGLLLLSITCLLGYAPVVAYAAGGAYQDSPLILALEYLPVFAWLAWASLRKTRDSKLENGSTTSNMPIT